MRAMPHKPDAKSLQVLAAALREQITTEEARRKEKLDEGDAQFFADIAELHFIRAELDYFFEAPLPQVAKAVKLALADAREALRLGRPANAWHLWDYLTYSLAVSDREAAEFFASLPARAWDEKIVKPVPWLTAQVKAAAALVRVDPAVGRLLEQLRILVFDEILPEALDDLLPQIRNTCLLLEGVSRREAKAFHEAMASRAELRAEYYGRLAPAAPIALLDLAGLGLCRLAKDRGMEVDVRHVTLPLELLG
ncbi:MAG: immunity 49 family protein [Planctomycetes bacterium]|nr:immunity 49 family protein [Planctomycetota bacterium]